MRTSPRKIDAESRSSFCMSETIDTSLFKSRPARRAPVIFPAVLRTGMVTASTGRVLQTCPAARAVAAAFELNSSLLGKVFPGENFGSEGFE